MTSCYSFTANFTNQVKDVQTTTQELYCGIKPMTPTLQSHNKPQRALPTSSQKQTLESSLSTGSTGTICSMSKNSSLLVALLPQCLSSKINWVTTSPFVLISPTEIWTSNLAQREARSALFSTCRCRRCMTGTHLSTLA